MVAGSVPVEADDGPQLARLVRPDVDDLAAVAAASAPITSSDAPGRPSTAIGKVGAASLCLLRMRMV